MYRINISFIVEPRAHGQWLDFMRGTFLLQLAEKGYNSYTFSRVLPSQAEAHHTYSLLVELPSMAAYADITGPVWDTYRAVADPLFSTDVLWLVTLMKNVEND